CSMLQLYRLTLHDALPISSRYGTAPGQEGDLNLPHGAAAPPVVVLLHGGFWRMPYGREQLDAASNALAARGYATWNLGYRRLGIDRKSTRLNSSHVRISYA